ncbi:MAG TPA: 5-guanidino-2-oxopentanoate decarboxylase [Solirubrobacter sp.]|nr:5-guanidino-2-oxopentanoate decarboxylase [Solirubrobacter sp.]
MTAGEAVVRALADHGVELVFGIPGTHTLELHRHLAAHGIRHVTPRHETGGGYAADGYARITGRPGVLLVTSGPGVINAATAAATAYADSVPMLILSPAMPTHVEGRDTGFLHETKNQGAAMDALVAWSHTASDPDDAVEAIHAAFAHFTSARPRPVHVQIPIDFLRGTVPVKVRPAAQSQNRGAERPRGSLKGTVPIKEALRLLAGAGRPVVVAGGGARGADLAALGMPVITTVNGKGVLDERHPLSLGASIRLKAAQRFLSEADVVLAIGTELGESDLWGDVPPLQRVIRVDIDPAQRDKNVRAEVAIIGDAREVSAALAQSDRATVDLDGVRAAIRAEALEDGAPWLPLMAALDEALGERGILAGDSTQAAYYGAVHFLDMDPRRRFIYPTGYATLGYALPAAIGAKLAAPDRRVIALIGDGGLLFTVAELATAAELGLPLPVVVPNNAGYGEIRDQMVEAGIAPVGVDLKPPDLPALGGAFGGAGVRVEDAGALGPVLREALERPGPTVIEVPAPG